MKRLANFFVLSALLFPVASIAATQSSYPTKTAPIAGDKALIVDSADGNKTKQATVGSLPVSTATQSALDSKQNRVTGTCGTGQAVQAVAVDGTVTCVDASSASMAWPSSDGAYYAARNGAWESLSGLFAPSLGADDNYVTDAEKAKISGIAAGAEVNVNADWNASSGDAQILNKPTIPSSVNDLSDVDTTGKSAGKILVFNSSGNLVVGDDQIGAAGTGDITDVVAGTGLTGGATSGSATLSLANTTVTPGSYTRAGITVDAQGRITSASSGEEQTNITGNAATSTALASNGTNCSSGQAALGVDASGNAEGCWTPSNGSMSWPSSAGVAVYGGSSAWGTSLTIDTDLSSVSAIDDSVPSAKATKAALDALPNLVFGNGLTVAEDTPSVGTDTISVTTNTYQPYDADWLGVTPNGASLISAANYAAMRALLDLEVGTDFNAYDADLTTWAGVTPGTGVTTALAANTGAVGGLPTIIASGAYTVDTASISANTCASAVAVTASGVATTDVVIATPSAILSSVAGFGVTTDGSVRVDVYPTSDNVNFQFCNPTGSAIDPGSVTFNWKVIR